MSAEDLSTPTSNKSFSWTKILLGLFIIIIVGLAIAFYYDYSLKYPSTDDAYVNANLVNIAPKVGGFISDIQVKKNQLVHKGDLLFALNPIDYSLSAQQVKQNLAYAEQQANVVKQNIAINQANVIKAQSDYDFNHKMALRYANLFRQQAASQQDMQQYNNRALQAKLQLDQAKLNLAQAITQYQAGLAQVKSNQLALASALTQTSYTQVRSAVTGYVTNLNLANGQLVQAGQNVFGLIDDASWWVEANFKETQLQRIHIGQPVKIKLDMYDHVYTGQVTSISRGSGNTFSILPAQNATGNWVKVTQRFAVVIKVNDEASYPLRVGASALVTIDTTRG